MRFLRALAAVVLVAGAAALAMAQIRGDGFSVAQYLSGGSPVSVTTATPLPVTGSSSLPIVIAPLPVTTTMATAAPTTPTFSSILAASSTRKACLVQNTGTTLAYVYFGATGSASTSNSFQVAANGGTISCNTPGGPVLTDNVAATCSSGTCAFIIASQ